MRDSRGMHGDNRVRRRHPYGQPHDCGRFPGHPRDEESADAFARPISSPRPPYGTRDRWIRLGVVLAFLACVAVAVWVAQPRSVPPSHEMAASARPSPPHGNASTGPRPLSTHRPPSPAPSAFGTVAPSPRSTVWTTPAPSPEEPQGLTPPPRGRRAHPWIQPRREPARPLERLHRPPLPATAAPHAHPTSNLGASSRPGPAWLYRTDPCASFAPFQRPTCHAYLGR